jgi:competence protein ComEC
MVASIATAPYSLYHFGQMASYSVLANALSMPVSGIIIMPMLIVSYILIPFGEAEWSLKLMGTGVEWLLDIARWTQGLSGAVITMSAFSELAVVMVSIAGLVLILFHGRGRLWAVFPLSVAILSIVSYRAPDILVSGDGAVVAVKDSQRIYLSSDRKDKFAVETWLRRWDKKTDDVVLFPRQGIIRTEAGAIISCDPAACRIERQGIKLSFGKRAYELQQDCDWANIIVSDARLHKDFCGHQAVRVFGYYEFFRNGAVAITAGNTVEIKTVGEERGQRPWSIRSERVAMSLHRQTFRTDKNLNSNDTSASEKIIRPEFQHGQE